jgi:hypothetical protein
MYILDDKEVIIIDYANNLMKKLIAIYFSLLFLLRKVTAT